MLSNSVNIAPRLTAQTTQIQQLIASATQSIENKNDANRALVIQQITNAVIDIVAESDENQAILESLTSINGDIDSSATAINANTNEKAAQILTAIQGVIDAVNNSNQSVIKSIQRGQIIISNTSDNDVSVASVNTNKSILLLSQRFGLSRASSIVLPMSVSGYIVNETTLRFRMGGSSYGYDGPGAATWELIEYV